MLNRTQSNEVSAQLELGFGRTLIQRPAVSASRRQRAAWWFRKMREVVDRSVAWKPAPSGRPEQLWIAGTSRQLVVSE